MLQFNQSDIAAVLTLTLTERASMNEPYFLFVFTHVLTKQTVKFIKFSDDDESEFNTRYNQYTINPSVVFLDKPVGQYNYIVYEQVSSTNTDISLTGAAIEHGKLILDRAIAFSYSKYNKPTTISTYNG